MYKKQFSRSLIILLYMLLGIGIFTVARLGVFIAYNHLYSDYTFMQIVSTFISGARFDIVTFFYATIPAWILLLLPIKKQWFFKIPALYMLLIYFVCAGFLIGDAYYFKFSQRHTTNELIAMMNDLAFLIDMIVANVNFFTVSGVVIIYGLIIYLWYKVAKLNVAPYLSWKTGVASFVIWVVLINIGLRGNLDIKPLSTIDAYAGVDATLGNLALNGIFTTVKYSDKNSNVRDDIYTFFDNDMALDIINEGKANVSLIPDAIANLDKPNIIFIMLEGVSPRYFESFSDNNENLMPNLDAYAQKSIIYTNHYSPDLRSITSIQAALTGIPPMTGLPAIGTGLEASITTNIGQTFVDNGYETIFVQASKRRSFYLDAIATSLGFQTYYGWEDFDILLDYEDESSSKFGWDYETLMHTSKMIKGSDKPFFSFTFLGTTHVPFPKLPEQFMKYPHDIQSEESFKNTLAYTDWAFNEFMNSIKDEDWYSNTVFIITSDHTTPHVQYADTREMHRVPLMIYIPANKQHAIVDNVSSHLDMPATLLDIAKLSTDDNEYLYGSIFGKDNESFMVANAFNTATILTKDGSLSHSFNEVLGTTPDNMNDDVKQSLTDKLLAHHQIGFIFADSNKKRKLLEGK